MDRPPDRLARPPADFLPPLAESADGRSPWDDALRRLRRQRQMAVVLFLGTCLSTFLVGAFGREIWPDPSYWHEFLETERTLFLHRGASFAAVMMAFLVAHEAGHFLQMRRYRVWSGWPYFLPFPLNMFGTLGAVIPVHPGSVNRREMFDIALTGPLAGLAVVVPLLLWCVHQAEIVPVPEGVRVLNHPLLVQGLIWYFHGTIPPGHDLLSIPLARAGWAGLFITGLNLLPFGVFDGGHILQGLVPRFAARVARGLFVTSTLAVIFAGYFWNEQYFVWLVQLTLIYFLFGTDPIPTRDDHQPLDTRRRLLGWLTLLLPIVLFVPQPFRLT